MYCKIARKIFAVLICAALVQPMPAALADGDASGNSAGVNCKYNMDFAEYNSDTDISGIGITQNATKETFEKFDASEYTSGATAQIVYDDTINSNVLEFNPCNYAETKIGENLNFELKDKLYKQNGPFTMTIRYNTPDVLKHANGSLNMIGTDADGNRKILYFGDYSYLASTPQRQYRRLMIGNSLWTSNSTLKPNAYLTMSSMSKTVNKYITYKYVVDPTTETFKFYYKPDDSEKWTEPYAAYELPTGPIPDVVTSLRFSLYENDDARLSEDSKYKIASISINQGLELVSSEPESGGKLKGKLIKLHLNSPVDESSLNAASVSVERNGEALIFGYDYNVRLSSEDSQVVEIVLDALPNGGDEYKIILNDAVNTASDGYARLDSGDVISVGLTGAVDEGYVHYLEDYDEAPDGDLLDYDGVYKYSKSFFSASQTSDDTYFAVDTTDDGEKAVKLKTNIDASGKGTFLNIELPEPIETAKGNVVMSFSLYGEAPEYMFRGPQVQGYNTSNPSVNIRRESGLIAYSNDAVRYPDGANIYTKDQLKQGWYDISYDYNPSASTVTVKTRNRGTSAWTEKTFNVAENNRYPDFIKTVSFLVSANSNMKAFGMNGVYWIDNVEISQVHTPSLVSSTVKDGDTDVDNHLGNISLEFSMPITESSANSDNVKLYELTDGEMTEVTDVSVHGSNNSDGTRGLVDVGLTSPLKADTKYSLQIEKIEANTVMKGTCDKIIIKFTTAENYVLSAALTKENNITVNAHIKANAKNNNGKDYVIFAALTRKSDGAILKFDFDKGTVSDNGSVYYEQSKTFVFDKPQESDGEYCVVVRLLNGFEKTYSLVPKIILE